jgi:radical SAM superfamily enzyme YgiQ (UPF0313 family)
MASKYKNSKIILIYPKPGKLERGCLPLSLLAIARMIDFHKYDVKIINSTTDDNYKQKIIEYGKEALCFGISCMTSYQIQDALNIAAIIKRNYPSVPIVWGGYHPSLLPEQTVRHPCVDIVIKGQGERTFQELVSRLSEGSSLENLRGIVYKKENNIVNNPDRSFEDINNFPPIPYHLIETEKCIKKNRYGMRAIDYISSQGCPYSCGFCCEPRFCKRTWTGLKAERVVDELEYLVNNFNINTFIIRDSNFFVNKERVEKICQRIIEKKLKINLRGVNARTDLARWSDNTWKCMRNAGLDELLIGAESGSQDVLNLINKNVTVEDTFFCAEKCAKHGINICLSLMIGLPTINTHEETEKTIQLIDRVLKICKNKIKVRVLLFLYTPYPGSDLYDLAINCGFRPPKTFEEWQNFELHKFEAPWVLKKYIRLTRQLHFNILRYVTNNVNFDGLVWHTRIPAKIIEKMAILRWRFKFFSFPIEYQIFNYYISLKKRVGHILKLKRSAK